MTDSLMRSKPASEDKSPLSKLNLSGDAFTGYNWRTPSGSR